MSNKQKFLLYCKELTGIIKQFANDSTIYISIDTSDRINIFSNCFTDMYIRIEAEKALLKSANNYNIAPSIKCFSLTQLALNPDACLIHEFILKSLSEIILFAEIDIINGIIAYLNSPKEIIETAISLLAKNIEKLAIPTSQENKTDQILMAVDNSTSVITHATNFEGSFSAAYTNKFVRELPEIKALKHEYAQAVQAKLMPVFITLNGKNITLNPEFLTLLQSKGYHQIAAAFSEKNPAMGAKESTTSDLNHNISFLSPATPLKEQQPTPYTTAAAGVTEENPPVCNVTSELKL